MNDLELVVSSREGRRQARVQNPSPRYLQQACCLSTGGEQLKNEVLGTSRAGAAAVQ